MARCFAGSLCSNAILIVFKAEFLINFSYNFLEVLTFYVTLTAFGVIKTDHFLIEYRSKGSTVMLVNQINSRVCKNSS